MVKLRTPDKKPKPTQKQIDEFAAGADGAKDDMDPLAPRNYKSVRVMINRYESECLAKLARVHNRSQMSFLRWAIVEMAKKLDKK